MSLKDIVILIRTAVPKLTLKIEITEIIKSALFPPYYLFFDKFLQILRVLVMATANAPLPVLLEPLSKCLSHIHVFVCLFVFVI